MGIGALTALLLAIEFFGVGGFIDDQVAILSIPAGALVGLIVKEVLTLLRLSRQARYIRR
jgi:hypothetical protein